MSYVAPQVTVLGAVRDVTLGSVAEDTQDEDRYYEDIGEGVEDEE
ncbi:lasso RiPP family leader peptide-containing protein [Streptomyces mayteni]